MFLSAVTFSSRFRESERITIFFHLLGLTYTDACEQEARYRVLYVYARVRTNAISSHRGGLGVRYVPGRVTCLVADYGKELPVLEVGVR
jgi:hypothetical protein